MGVLGTGVFTIRPLGPCPPPFGPSTENVANTNSGKITSLFYQGACMSGWSLTATHALELLASVSARTHVSDTEFVMEPVSTPQTQALNQNHSMV